MTLSTDCQKNWAKENLKWECMGILDVFDINRSQGLCEITLKSLYFQVLLLFPRLVTNTKEYITRYRGWPTEQKRTRSGSIALASAWESLMFLTSIYPVGLVTSLQTLLLTDIAYLVSSLGCCGISMYVLALEK
jgi:hypothetical protein